MATDEFDPMDHETPEADLAAVEWLAMKAADLRIARLALNPQEQPAVAVEIGTWAGGTALEISLFCDVYCVDHWEGSPGDRMADLSKRYTPLGAFQTFCRNMGDRLMVDVIPCVGRSLSWASIWPKSTPIDLLYIDGDHRYEAVKADIAAWLPHVRKDGVIAGHDYHMDGVKQAVDERFGKLVTIAGHCVWYVDLKDARPQ